MHLTLPFQGANTLYMPLEENEAVGITFNTDIGVTICAHAFINSLKLIKSMYRIILPVKNLSENFASVLPKSDVVKVLHSQPVTLKHSDKCRDSYFATCNVPQFCNLHLAQIKVTPRVYLKYATSACILIFSWMEACTFLHHVNDVSV